MRKVVLKDYEEMCKYASNIVEQQIKSNPKSVLGLPTGSTPIGMYRDLIRKNLDFSGVTTFNLDEYYGLPKSNDQSYDYFMRSMFFNYINIDKNNINIPNGEAPDAAEECARYDAAIIAAGGIDLQVLGVGVNGHIGFNEPADALSPTTNLVKLTPSTIEVNSRFFDKAEDVPKTAITMGMGNILQAKKIIILVNGKSKTDILKRTFSEGVTTQNPSSFLLLHPDVTYIVDEEANGA